MCFIIDGYSRKFIDLRPVKHMRPGPVLEAIEMSSWVSFRYFLELQLHTNSRSQFASIRYGECPAEVGVALSIGSVGESFDSALVGAEIRYRMVELVRAPDIPGSGITLTDSNWRPSVE